MAAVVTTNDVASKEVLPDLLKQLDSRIEQVSGNGSYDTFDRQSNPIIKPTAGIASSPLVVA